MNSISSTLTSPLNLSYQINPNIFETYHLAEWLIYPDPIESIIYNTAEEQSFNLPMDIVKLVTGYLQTLEAFNNVFGPKDWNAIFGKVQHIKPTYEMEVILQRQCPFNPLKKVKETCIYVLIPNRVNGETLTLDAMEEFAKNPLHNKTYLNIFVVTKLK